MANVRISDMRPLRVAIVAAVVIAAALALVLNINRLPFVHSTKTYSAYLTNASGLTTGDTVQVRGVQVGTVTRLSLHGNSVRVEFAVDSGMHLGTLTSAAVKVLNPLGTEFLALTPSGPGTLAEPIPTSRTNVSVTLLGDLGQVSTEVQSLDVDQLQQALNVTSTNLSATSQQAVSKALTGLARFSATLGNHAQDVQKIVTQGASIAHILAQRKDELVNLVGQGDAVLRVLEQRHAQVTQLLNGTADLSREVDAILQVNEARLNPMLRDLQHISDVLGQENQNISAALPALASLSAHLAAATGNGPFLDVVVPTGLLPDSLIRQCKPSAFPASDNPIVGCRP